MNERAGKRRRARSGAGVLGILGSIAFAVVPVPAHASPPSPPHIMLIVEENAAYGSAQGTPYIINNPSAPYINSLAGTYTSATNWYAVQHNSPHDYLDLLDGSDLGVPIGKPYSSTTLVDELHTAGIPWQGYMESMPAPCSSVNSTSDGQYDAVHNPFHYFTNYSAGGGGWCSSANAGSEGVVPYPGSSGIAAALDGANAPAFAFVVPNDCNDMHGDTSAASPCATDTSDQLVTAGDSWLQTNLPQVMSSNWYTSGGIIIITWDESADGDTSGGSYGIGGHVPTLVISANSQHPFATSGDHYATLRGIEEAYVVDLLGNSADPAFGDITPAFGVPVSAPPPSVTGVAPTQGPQEGGELVTVSGTHFNGSGFTTSDLHFGTIDVPPTNAYPCPGSPGGCFAVTSPTEITAYTPRSPAPGTVDVTVTTPGGTTATGAADHYVYVPPPLPSVTGVAPTEGAQEGGELVTLSGTNFNGSGVTTSDVHFGTIDVPATNPYPCPGSPGGCFAVTSPTEITAYTPQSTAPGTVDVTVTTPGGTTAASAADHYVYVAPGAYTAMTAFRVCDTRALLPHNQCTGKTLGAKGTLTVQVTGERNALGQVVPNNAEAVAVNVTAINDSTSATYVTAFPAGATVPLASNINLNGQNAQANLVVVQLGTGGAMSVFNAAGRADVIVDIQGYFAPPGASPVAGAFHPMRPLRICDTRAGQGTVCAGAVNNPIRANTWRDVVLSGLPPGGNGPAIPSDGTAAAAVFNLTGTQGSATTYLSVEPPDPRTGLCPTGAPSVSNINLPPGSSLPNRVIASLGSHQDVCVYNSTGSANIIIDIDGWFGNGSETSTGALFYAVSPTRICDTRAGSGTECQGQALTAGATEPVPVAGVLVVPATGGSTPPVAMVANLTGVGGSAATYLTLYPGDVTTRPLASDLNPAAGITIANLAIVGLATTGGSSGNIDLYNAAGDINAILDVAGWFQ